MQGKVSELKQNAVNLAARVSDDNKAIERQIATAEAIHLKGATLSLTGSFIASETVWRASHS
jgi:hypothetical protein